jgi:dienelactone hydrolase
LIAALIVSGCNTTPIKPLPDAKRVGVVLMHGKGGTPNSMNQAASIMRGAGAIVLTPEMLWSRYRIYAKSYDDSMQEIDAALLQLKKEGAEIIFVGGQSMGANAALGYAASGRYSDGLILFAPGHVPSMPGFAARVADSVEKAKRMVNDGRGDDKANFGDINQGSRSTVLTTANIYLSWFDPKGPAVMPTNASKVPPNTRYSA